MGLLTFIQIPCHHVLANEIDLNFFNINLGLAIIKKTTFLFVFSHHHHVFQVFLVFGVVGSIKSMLSGYLLDVEFNSASNELSWSKFEWKHKEICQKYKQKKVVFFMIPIPKFILKNCLRGAPFLILKNFDWKIHDDMDFV